MAAQLVKDLAVAQPADGLVAPAAGGGAVDLQGPGVPVVVEEGPGTAAAEGLVAGPAVLVGAAVDGAVGGRGAVDGLEDVDLAAEGPVGAVVDAVAEQPEGGPDALLGLLRVVAEADGGLEHGELAGARREGRLGLDAGRGPAARARLARHQLDGAAARDLDILVRRRVVLNLVVGLDAGS